MKRRASVEHQHQAAVIRWATLATPRIPQLALLFAVPNAARRTVGEAAWMKAEGMKAGVPDLWLPCRGVDPSYIGLVIEMKSPTGTLTESQKDWRDRLIGAGWYWALCRSFDEARAELCRYLGAKP